MKHQCLSELVEKTSKFETLYYIAGELESIGIGYTQYRIKDINNPKLELNKISRINRNSCLRWAINLVEILSIGQTNFLIDFYDKDNNIIHLKSTVVDNIGILSHQPERIKVWT